jgi:uncharacterized repeat protein (TIGR03803 family)
MKLARAFAVVLAGAALPSFSISAQILTVLHNFTNNESVPIPQGRLVLGGGTVYGTDANEGSNGLGIVYSVNTDGTDFAVLHDFSSDTNGGSPEGGLLLSGDTLYGVTALGGTNGPWGTIFSVGTNGGGFFVLHNFDGDPSIGQHPHARLTLEGSRMYGVASGQASPGWGSLFSIETDGSGFNPFYTFTTPHNSSSGLTNIDGEQPQGALIPSAGILYGTAYGGGTGGYGTVFSITPDGNNFTLLHAFTNNPDGAYVRGGLMLVDEVLYGTTWLGGLNNQGTVFSVHTDGSGYQVLHSFLTNGVDGKNPYTGLVLWHHTLFGTTQQGGGASSHGTIFSINTNGSAYTILHTFVLPSGTFTNSDGTEPMGDLTISRNTLYGTTQRGGYASGGTAFSLSLPRPGITRVGALGSNVTLNATNGVPGENYILLGSSDVRLPAAQWLSVATNTADVTGNLTYSVADSGAAGAAQRFYMLQMQ